MQRVHVASGQIPPVAKTFMAPIGSRKLSPRIASGLIMLADAISLHILGFFSLVITYPVNLGDCSLLIFVNLLLFLIIAHVGQLHEFSRFSAARPQIGQMAAAWCLALAVLICVVFLVKASSHLSRAWIGTWLLTGLIYCAVSRVILARCVLTWRAAGKFVHHVAIIGAGPDGEKLIQELVATPAAGARIVGIYDDRTDRVPSLIMGHALEGPPSLLRSHIRSKKIEIVIIALPLAAEKRILELLKQLRPLPVDVCLASGDIGVAYPITEVLSLGHVAVLKMFRQPLKDWAALAKDLEDVLVASFVIAALAPLFLLVAALIKLESPGKVLFRQLRFGFNNEPIEVFKFRTMYRDRCDASGAQQTIRNDQRVTPLGRLLRRTSIDELPQLFNVLRRDMSIVGPRAHPIAMRAAGQPYAEVVADYAVRHRVRPGITGWAQVNCLRGEVTSLDHAIKRLEHDLYYIENWSVWFDLKILALTGIALVRRGAY